MFELEILKNNVIHMRRTHENYITGGGVHTYKNHLAAIEGLIRLADEFIVEGKEEKAKECVNLALNEFHTLAIWLGKRKSS